MRSDLHLYGVVVFVLRTDIRRKSCPTLLLLFLSSLTPPNSSTCGENFVYFYFLAQQFYIEPYWVGVEIYHLVSRNNLRYIYIYFILSKESFHDTGIILVGKINLLVVPSLPNPIIYGSPADKRWARTHNSSKYSNFAAKCGKKVAIRVSL